MYITFIYIKNQSEGDDLLVIENISVVSCPLCGGGYLTAETLHEIERIKLHRSSWDQERKVLAVKGCEVRRSLIRSAGKYVNVFGFLRNLLGVMIGGRMAEGIPT